MSDARTRNDSGQDSFFSLVHVYLFVTFFTGTALTAVFPHAVLTIVKAIELGCILCAAVYCYVNHWYAPAGVAVFSLLYGIFVLLRFIEIASVPFNFAAGYPIYAFGGVAVMYGAMRINPNRVVRLLYCYATCYVVALFLFSFVPFLKAILMHSAMVGYGHEGNAGRISMTFLYPVMVAALGVDAALRGKMSGQMLTLLLMAMACIIFSDFRMGEITTLAILAGYALMRLLSFRVSSISKVFTAGTALVLALLALFYVLDLNPYFILFRDASAFARAVGFYVIRGAVQFSPLWGGGLPPDGGAFNWAGPQMGAKFYDSDYGIFGILVWGGLVAEMLYLAVLFLAYRFAEDLRRIGVDMFYVGGLAMTGWFQMAYNITVPTNMIAGYTEFACLIFACALLAFERKKLLPATSRRLTGTGRL